MKPEQKRQIVKWIGYALYLLLLFLLQSIVIAESDIKLIFWILITLCFEAFSEMH